MGAHILLASEANFEVCARRGVYGCVMPSTERNRAEVVAGILSVQTGDLVFFYVKSRGVYGLWKVVGAPYFDQTRVWPDDEQAYPYRIALEPAVGDFPKPVSFVDVLDLHDKGQIWTFDLSPVQRKNQYKITMAEARELLRLLLRNNPVRLPPRPLEEPYVPVDRVMVDVDLRAGGAGQVQYEGWLNAWFMHSLSRGHLKPILGDYQEYLNLVPTSLNKVMDIFLTHVTTIGSIDVLYKYTCLELKGDRATEADLAQVLRYGKMLARKLSSGDEEMIQTVLVARRFTDDVVSYASDRQRIEEKTVRLVSYQVTDDRQDIILRELLPA